MEYLAPVEYSAMRTHQTLSETLQIIRNSKAVMDGVRTITVRMGRTVLSRHNVDTNFGEAIEAILKDCQGNPKVRFYYKSKDRLNIQVE